MRTFHTDSKPLRRVAEAFKTIRTVHAINLEMPLWVPFMKDSLSCCKGGGLGIVTSHQFLSGSTLAPESCPAMSPWRPSMESLMPTLATEPGREMKAQVQHRIL